ncbi:MAG: GNAT family N-acetyltransferase [Nanoarchaeota archaeon]|nr:GNAT family N-acetyltransferase [Nanoarchaeota archaeon]
MVRLGDEIEKIANQSLASITRRKKIASREINNIFGDINSFKSELRESVIMTPDDPNFSKVYDLYSRVFTLEQEMEPEEGLKQVLELNTEPKFGNLYGPMKEQWLVMSHPLIDKVIGASNISMYLFDDLSSRTVGTMHETYVMVAPEYRRIGIGSLLLKRNSELLMDFWLENEQDAPFANPNMYVFNEQNDPLRMTVEEYIADTKSSGIDQCDRLIWWQRRNYGELEFNYVQPPLDENSDPCYFLTLNIRTNQDYVPSSLVLMHLQRFVHFSVLKGKDPMEGQNFMDMKRELEPFEHIAILRPDYLKLKHAIHNLDVTPEDCNTPIFELIRRNRIELRPFYN